MATPTLTDLGWSPFFQSQLSIEDLENLIAARVIAAHRGAIDVLSTTGECRLPLPNTDRADDDIPTVGDWVLINPETGTVERLLTRTSIFKRKAPGHDRRTQLIAANVDTLFIVTSCNQDFNLARLERYLVLAGEAGVAPVIVLTKADLCDDVHPYTDEAARLGSVAFIEAVDATSKSSVEKLEPWCVAGQTVAVVGSSGVGKSTLLNSLAGKAVQATQSIRIDDAKGRHTTSGRSLHHLPSGGWVLDTPGIRELQLTDVEQGLGQVFEDIFKLALQCRFSDCAHLAEPDCAVKDAIGRGHLDEKRLLRFQKLSAEDARNTESTAERRAKDKKFGKLIKGVQQYRKFTGKE
jgi:ribosome biogenesis GTPase